MCLRLKMIKIRSKYFKILLLALATAMPFASPVLAVNVKLSVEVVERKPTDTINDFDFSTVNMVYSDSGSVAGVSTAGVSTSNLRWCPRG